MGMCAHFCPPWRDAREVMQNTAAILWKKFDQLDNPENFRRWAFGVARFEVLSYRRDKARDRHVFSEELLMQLASEAEKNSEQTMDEIRALKICLN